MSIKIEKTENNNELKLEFTIEAKKFDEAIIKIEQNPGFHKMLFIKFNVQHSKFKVVI